MAEQNDASQNYDLQIKLSSLTSDFTDALRTFKDTLAYSLSTLNLTMSNLNSTLTDLGVKVASLGATPVDLAKSTADSVTASQYIHASTRGSYLGAVPQVFGQFATSQDLLGLINDKRPASLNPYDFYSEKNRELSNRLASNGINAVGSLTESTLGTAIGSTIVNSLTRMLGPIGGTAGTLVTGGANLLAGPMAYAVGARIADKTISPIISTASEFVNDAAKLQRESIHTGTQFTSKQAREAMSKIYELGFKDTQKANAYDIRMGTTGYKELAMLGLEGHMLGDLTPANIEPKLKQAANVVKILTGILNNSDVRVTMSTLKVFKDMGINGFDDPGVVNKIGASAFKYGKIAGLTSDKMIKIGADASAAAYGAMGLPAYVGMEESMKNVAYVRELERSKRLSTADIAAGGGVERIAGDVTKAKAAMFKSEEAKMILASGMDFKTGKIDFNKINDNLRTKGVYGTIGEGIGKVFPGDGSGASNYMDLDMNMADIASEMSKGGKLSETSLNLTKVMLAPYHEAIGKAKTSRQRFNQTAWALREIAASKGVSMSEASAKAWAQQVESNGADELYLERKGDNYLKMAAYNYVAANNSPGANIDELLNDKEKLLDQVPRLRELAGIWTGKKAANITDKITGVNASDSLFLSSNQSALEALSKGKPLAAYKFIEEAQAASEKSISNAADRSLKERQAASEYVGKSNIVFGHGMLGDQDLTNALQLNGMIANKDIYDYKFGTNGKQAMNAGSWAAKYGSGYEGTVDLNTAIEDIQQTYVGNRGASLFSRFKNNSFNVLGGNREADQELGGALLLKKYYSKEYNTGLEAFRNSEEAKMDVRKELDKPEYANLREIVFGGDNSKVMKNKNAILKFMTEDTAASKELQRFKQDHSALFSGASDNYVGAVLANAATNVSDNSSGLLSNGRVEANLAYKEGTKLKQASGLVMSDTNFAPFLQIAGLSGNPELVNTMVTKTTSGLNSMGFKAADLTNIALSDSTKGTDAIATAIWNASQSGKAMGPDTVKALEGLGGQSAYILGNIAKGEEFVKKSQDMVESSNIKSLDEMKQLLRTTTSENLKSLETERLNKVGYNVDNTALNKAISESAKIQSGEITDATKGFSNILLNSFDKTKATSDQLALREDYNRISTASSLKEKISIAEESLRNRGFSSEYIENLNLKNSASGAAVLDKWSQGSLQGLADVHAIKEADAKNDPSNPINRCIDGDTLKVRIVGDGSTKNGDSALPSIMRWLMDKVGAN